VLLVQLVQLCITLRGGSRVLNTYYTTTITTTTGHGTLAIQ
jgi:hypothetical protein